MKDEILSVEPLPDLRTGGAKLCDHRLKSRGRGKEGVVVAVPQERIARAAGKQVERSNIRRSRYFRARHKPVRLGAQMRLKIRLRIPEREQYFLLVRVKAGPGQIAISYIQVGGLPARLDQAEPPGSELVEQQSGLVS